MSAQLDLYIMGASRVGKIDACPGCAPAPTTCRAIQQSDEMHCAICGLRWDVNDGDPPKCGRANFGDLDSPAPNHFDHSKRGFQPK